VTALGFFRRLYRPVFPSKLSPLEALSLSPTAEASSPSLPEELSSLEELSLLEVPSPSPTADASSPSLPEELSSLEAPSPSLTAETSSPSPFDSKKVTFDAWITCLR